jgi:hypothetical protein
VPTPPELGQTSSPAAEARPVPPWFPDWAREFTDQYFSGTTCLFLLHGNVHDLLRLGGGRDGPFGGLPEFLTTQLFGTWSSGTT